jgi:hypothetical protein
VSSRIQPLRVVPAGADGFVGWLLYTRVFWGLQSAHATLPPCPFLYLTGHPCPFCGGTRSFAYMWRGDMTDAFRYYPLGPVLFAGTICAIPLLVLGLVLRRDVRLPRWIWKPVLAAVVVALACSWALKLTVLPN